MTTPGERRAALSEPEHCPFCGRKRQDEALQRHLEMTHRATMLLYDSVSGELIWPSAEVWQTGDA